ncbi:hypothetical protein [Methanolobus sp. WCC5]|uniref:hypothetical protein n=1 Tax=Methanolobus sp. WCC5 TaxID=3125785 RepID=UPI00324E9239
MVSNDHYHNDGSLLSRRFKNNIEYIRCRGAEDAKDTEDIEDPMKKKEVRKS